MPKKTRLTPEQKLITLHYTAKLLLQKLPASAVKLLKKKSGVKVLGLDPSTSGTGWFIAERAEQEWCQSDYGWVENAQKLPLEVKMKNISSRVEGLVKEYDPCVVCVEAVGSMSSFTGVAAVARAHGACYSALGSNRPHLTQAVNISHIKMIFGLRGNAKKEEVIDAANSYWNVKFESDNEADASGAALRAATLFEILSLSYEMERKEISNKDSLWPLDLEKALDFYLSLSRGLDSVGLNTAKVKAIEQFQDPSKFKDILGQSPVNRIKKRVSEFDSAQDLEGLLEARWMELDDLK